MYQSFKSQASGKKSVMFTFVKADAWEQVYYVVVQLWTDNVLHEEEQEK